MPDDMELLVQDKYAGDASKVTEEDRERLAAGEPLAYIIGWIPFLGLHLDLSTHPLIPRPETEWWTEQLIAHLHERFQDRPFILLDLCAGSGAIGLAILKEFPNAHVSFAELSPEHCKLIETNIKLNNLDESRARMRAGDLFVPYNTERFDIIATNPPYIPTERESSLDQSVTGYEPHEALFAGIEGLDLIKQITAASSVYLNPNGEVWLEADISHIEKVQELFLSNDAREAVILNDQYDRPRVVVSYWS